MHVGEHDDVEARLAVVGEVLERRARARRGRARRGRGAAAARESSRPSGLVAAPARLVEQQPVAAADVEQPPARRRERPIRSSRRRGRRAAPGLLGEVGVVAHVAVEVVQLRARRQHGLLDGAALGAREQVADASRSPWRPVSCADGASASAATTARP